MFTIKYDNGYSRFKVQFGDRWHRFYSHKAAYNKTAKPIGCSRWMFAYSFYSFGTPMLCIIRTSDGKLTQVAFNKEAWKCRPTTTRQCNRFIRDISLFERAIPYSETIIRKINECYSNCNINSVKIDDTGSYCIGYTTSDMESLISEILPLPITTTY